MQVKNQREYAAVLKEIDAAKASIGEHEEAILAAWTRSKPEDRSRGPRRAHRNRARDRRAGARVGRGRGRRGASGRRARHGERMQIESTLPASWWRT
jgi:hypothetical protein